MIDDIVTSICIDCGVEYQQHKYTKKRKRCDVCWTENNRRRLAGYRKNNKSSMWIPKKSELGTFSDYDYHMSLSEIADQFGVTSERIRQIERRALGKLKLNFPELEELM